MAIRRKTVWTKFSLTRVLALKKFLLYLVVGFLLLVFYKVNTQVTWLFDAITPLDTRKSGPLLPHLVVKEFHGTLDQPHHLAGEQQPPLLKERPHSPLQVTVGTRKPKHRTNRVGQSWKNHIIERCEENGVAWTRDNFKPEMLKYIVVDDTHKVLFCPIPKVACTTWVRVMLALTGKIKMEDTFTLPGNEIHSKWNQLNYLSQYNRDEALDRLTNYYKFIIVRDPFERILSAYRNKFETINLTGFHYVQGKPIVRKYRSGVPWKNIPLDQRYRPTFPEFLQYLSDPERDIRMNNHWEKFHHMCLPCVVQYDFVGNMNSMDKDANTILGTIGVADKIKWPTRQEVGYRHRKTGDLISRYYSNISESVMNNLYKEYRLDYEIFNITRKR